jgi:hypothetical protein
MLQKNLENCLRDIFLFDCCIYFQGVLDRFSQIKPKVIFSVNAVRYNGKIHNHLEKLEMVVHRE